MPRMRIVRVVVLLSILGMPLSAQEAPGERLTDWLENLWNRLAAPVTALWAEGRGGCDPNGGGCGPTEPLPEGRGACDPNGGLCEPVS